jgi:hypothetical protein
MIADRSFSDWALEWIRLATYTGHTVPRVDVQIERVVQLWNQLIPGTWQRGEDARLLDPDRRYCRSNDAVDAKRRGEHKIEYDLLHLSPAVRAVDVMGARLVDGVNAVPLAKDAAGGRLGNVEADLLLLVRNSKGRHRLEVVEVKVTSNDPWFASIENLRQLRLLKESTEARRLFVSRQSHLGLRASLPFSGLVLAPLAFYSGRGKKGNAVGPTQKLLDRMRVDAGVSVRLAVWERGSIRPLERSA